MHYLLRQMALSQNKKGGRAMRQWVRRCTDVTVLVGFIAILGLASAGRAGVLPSHQKNTELPRSFQGARLGMGHVDVVRAAHIPHVTGTASRKDIIVRHAPDPHVKRVEYRFHNGALFAVQTYYRPERIAGGKEALLTRLKETYGAPVVDEAMTFGPGAGVLSEKRTVWNDGRTEIAFVERERDIESKEIVLIMTDLQIAQMKEEAMRERQRQQVMDVPIPMPERGTSSRTAGMTTAEDRQGSLAVVAKPAS
jgi:hypothetical protein